MAGYFKRLGNALLGVAPEQETEADKRMQRSVSEPYSVADPRILELFGIDGGVKWSTTAAEGLPAVFSCISLISRDLSSLDWGVFSRDSDLILQEGHNVHELLRKPDKYLTKTQWMEVIIRNALALSNGYAEIVRDDRYRPTRLRFWKSNEVSIIEDANRDISYSTPLKTYVPYEDMIHFKFFSLDGKRGRTPLEVVRTMTEATLSMGEHVKSFYQNGAKMPGYLEVPARLQDLPDDNDKTGNRDGARERLRRGWQTVSQSGQVGILEQGTKFVPLNMNFGDAQLVQMLELGFYDICGIYGCPPSLVQRFQETKYSTSEQADLSYVKHTLAPYIDHIKEEFEEKLFNYKEAKVYQIKTDMRKLLKGDVGAMNEFYSTMLDKQVYTRNDVREDLGLGKREGYDEHMIPAGMMPEKVAAAYYAGSEVKKVDEKV